MTATHGAARLVDANPEKQSFRVHRDAYRSQEVFEREKELIFSKCWLYLAHESELKNNGDFLARRVGGRDLMFVKDREGKNGAFYNSCTHRGARICRETRGNARNFTCPYHGWVFNTAGKLRSMNAEHGFAADLNDDGHLDLLPVERLESYAGFYFVNYNKNAISLYDYLDGAREVLDLFCVQAETEMVVLPGEHSYTVKANYKLMAENSYDGYHLPSVHATYIDHLYERAAGNPAALTKIDETVKAFGTNGQIRSLGMGHAILESLVPTGRPVASWVPMWGPELKVEIEAKRAYLDRQIGKERADYVAEYQKNLVIFPNLVFNDILAATVRVVEPEAPDMMRVTAWAIGPKEESAALRAIRLDNFISFLGPAGFGSPDDIEMLELCQAGKSHTPVEWSELSKGYAGEGEGDLRYVGGAPTDENHIQAYWAQWDLVMRGIETLEVR